MKHDLIICEGNTDRTLIGLFIEGISEWKYASTHKANPFPKEAITWYTKDNNYIGIWENGSNDFTRAVEAIAQRETLEHSVERILIVTDHDDQTAEINRPQSIYDRFCNILNCDPGIKSLRVNRWVDFIYESAFEKAKCKLGYLLVPFDEEGALETFMLKTLSEKKDANKEIIIQVEEFIDDFRSETYLRSRRDRVKAKLGVALSVFEPDKAIYSMKEILYSVDWTEYDATSRQFEMIRSMLASH